MSDFFPAGIIVPFAGKSSNVPNGWLLCDGRPFKKTDYPNLFDAIGTNWGGDATPNFFLPDLQGKFLRGVSYLSNSDPEKNKREPSRPDLGTNNAGNSGNEVGSFQNFALQVHKHNDLGHTHPATTDGATRNGEWCDSGDSALVCGDEIHNASVTVNNSSAVISDPVSSSTPNIPPVITSVETRPVNVYVNYIIKY